MATDQPPGGSDPNQPRRTVRATRRRPGQPADAAGRERAEAPNREQPQQQTQAGGGGQPPRPPQPMYTQPQGGGAAGRRRMSPILLIGVVLLLLLFGGPALFSGLGGSAPQTAEQLPQEPQQPVQQATQRPQPTPRPQASTGAAQSAAAAAGTGGDRWLIMLYQDADDRVLEQDIMLDLNEAELVGSNDQVTIVAQVDRYQGGYAADGDWTSTKRFLVTRDDDFNRLGSQEVADLGELNMADSATLVDFASWAIQTYPADKYALILSDHGMGWPGGWSDPTAPTRGPQDLPLAQALGDQLYLMEIDSALEQIRSNTGIDKLEMLGMDACLMGHLEVFNAMAPHARYMVASQEVEPSVGWAYANFLTGLQQNPGMDGGELSRLIVDSYITADERIVNDQARAEFVGRGGGSLFGSLFGPVEAPSREQLTQQLSQNVTLSAVNLQNTAQLNDAVNALAYTLQQVDPRAVGQARSYSQSYTNVFGESVPPSYIDLGNFAQLLAQQTGDANVQSAAQGVLDALGSVVLAEKHGPNKPGATGASIYFPNSQLYANAAAGPRSYTIAARRFAETSLWDDFLAYYFTGRQFQQSAAEVAVPDRAQTIAPPTGAVQVSALNVSSPTTAIGNPPILLSADITGENVGYVKLMVGYVDQDANSIQLIDGDFLDTGDIREVDGVQYPNWGEGPFTLEFEWEPIVAAIDDGQTAAPVYLQPQNFGATPEEAIYAVDGVYTFADGGEQRPARLLFSSDRLRQVLTYTGADAGAPWEVAPRTGDTFQIAEQWLDVNSNGQISEPQVQLGQTLTFGDDVFTLRDLDAAPGNYVVGFIVEDLDGQATPAYGQVQVQ